MIIEPTTYGHCEDSAGQMLSQYLAQNKSLINIYTQLWLPSEKAGVSDKSERRQA